MGVIGDWPPPFPGAFGLVHVPTEPVPEVWEGLKGWLDENCPGEDIPLPPVPRLLPLLPLDIRIYMSERFSDARVQEVLEDFELARSWWRQFGCVDLRLHLGTVERMSDPDGTLYDVEDVRSPLEQVHVPDQSWLSIVYVNSGGFRDEGKTLFKNPVAERRSHGVVIKKAAAFTLTHEIGHALGLPHMPATIDAATDMEQFGMPQSSFCLLPFDNDIRGLPSCLQQANLMNAIDLGVGPPWLFDRWISYSQVDRVRLTITSRRCPWARLSADGMMFSPGEVLLNDISAAFVAEAFPGERIINAAKPLPSRR